MTRSLAACGVPELCHRPGPGLLGDPVLRRTMSKPLWASADPFLASRISSGIGGCPVLLGFHRHFGETGGHDVR